MWGGCISCPQFFMMPTAEKKSCCDEAGKCKRQSEKAPVQKDCQRMPLEPPSAGTHTAVVVPALPTPVLELVAEPVLAADFMVDRGLLPVEHSPPDIQLLNATFLI